MPRLKYSELLFNAVSYGFVNVIGSENKRVKALIRTQREDHSLLLEAVRTDIDSQHKLALHIY